MRPHRPYELQEYDPQWKQIFSDTAEKIRPIFGDNFIGIEHIGSTSIEGMVAKTQVDILVIVKDLDLVPTYYDAFTKAGYTPRGKEYVGNGDEYVTEDSPDGKRLVSIHIFQEGHPQINQYREFRDYLRIDKEDRDLYISTKRNLYVANKENYEGYDSGKEEVIKAIKTRAKAYHALSYIIPILEQLNLRWCITGGFACYVYGVPRPITDIDIDIEVSKDDPLFLKLLEIVTPNITSPLEHFVDQNYDNYNVEVMDILDICSMAEMDIFIKEASQYENFYKDGFPDIETKEYQGFKLPLLFKALIIKNKEMLVWQRESDLTDIAGLKNLK
jgi:GrpB-like predicted nucleotidyltransferase (UPF0157 family)